MECIELRVCSACLGEAGKPSPDIFLKTAAYFKQPAQNCLVIEDSTNGITAAKSAGMYCIGFKNNDTNKQNLSCSDLIISNFNKDNIDRILKFINRN